MKSNNKAKAYMSNLQCRSITKSFTFDISNFLFQARLITNYHHSLHSQHFEFPGLENESYELYMSLSSDLEGAMEFRLEVGCDIEYPDPSIPESKLTGPEFSVGVQSVVEISALPATSFEESSSPILFFQDDDWYVLSVYSTTFENSNVFESKIEGIKFADIEKLWQDKDDGARISLTLSLYYISSSKSSAWKQVDLGPEFKKKRKRRAPYMDHLTNRDKADMTIECDGREFAVHKLVLSCVSPVFDRMLETDMSEKETGVIKIQDVTPETVQLMLDFLYTGKLFSQKDTEDKPVDQVLIQLLDCAEKYGIDELKDQVGQEIYGNLTVMNAIPFFESLKIYKVDETIGGKVLEFCKKNLSAFPKDEIFKKFLTENVEALI